MKTQTQNFPKSCCQRYQELNEIQTLDTKQESTPDSVSIPCILTKQESREKFLGSYHEAPKYMQDNIYILTGYRINFDTCKKSLESCFMFSNNEFSNIWSHFIGIFIALSLIITLSSFIARNDNGIIQKTISDLDNIYDRYTNQILMQNNIISKQNTIQLLKIIKIRSSDNQNSNTKFNDILNKISFEDNYMVQVQTFEQILQEIVQLSKDQPITQSQRQQIHLVYSNLKGVITKEIFGFVRLSDDNDRRSSDPKQISKWPIFFFLLSSIICFSGSVVFHTFHSMNSKICDFLLRIDYAGICFIILGGCVPIIYYGFYCDSGLLNFYLLLVSFFCISVFIISLFDFVHSEKYRKFKGILYGTLGLSSAIPLVHLAYRTFYIESDVTDYLALTSSLPFYLLTGFSLFSGLGTYLARCPERFSPGRFDRIGNSHNIWHCCVVLGVIFSYLGSLETYYTRKQTFCYLK